MFGVFAFLNTSIASVTKNGFFFPMHQLVHLGNVMLVGGCRLNTVNQTRLGIGNNVSLHAKVPVIALLSLMHLRVRLPLAFLDEVGVSMKVASMMVPCLSSKPRSANIALISSRNRLANLRDSFQTINRASSSMNSGTFSDNP
jgi:hypothetical protein